MPGTRSLLKLNFETRFNAKRKKRKKSLWCVINWISLNFNIQHVCVTNSSNHVVVSLSLSGSWPKRKFKLSMMSPCKHFMTSREITSNYWRETDDAYLPLIVRPLFHVYKFFSQQKMFNRFAHSTQSITLLFIWFLDSDMQHVRANDDDYTRGSNCHKIAHDSESILCFDDRRRHFKSILSAKQQITNYKVYFNANWWLQVNSTVCNIFKLNFLKLWPKKCCSIRPPKVIKFLELFEMAQEN